MFFICSLELDIKFNFGKSANKDSTGEPGSNDKDLLRASSFVMNFADDGLVGSFISLESLNGAAGEIGLGFIKKLVRRG